jgi:hypothetical protein
MESFELSDLPISHPTIIWPPMQIKILKFSSNPTIFLLVSSHEFHPEIAANGHFGLLNFKRLRISMPRFPPQPLMSHHDCSHFLIIATDLNVCTHEKQT